MTTRFGVGKPEIETWRFKARNAFDNLNRTWQQLDQVLYVLKKNLTCSSIERRSLFKTHTRLPEPRRSLWVTKEAR